MRSREGGVRALRILRTYFSVRLRPYASRLTSSSVPPQRSPLPHVHVSHEQNHQEDEHLDQQESHPRPVCPPSSEEDRPPRDQEHRLNVEQNEQHRDQIELDREPLARAAQRRHAALVGGGL